MTRQSARGVDDTTASDGTAPSVLADGTALSVLSALDEPATAREAAERCGVGLSTAYRKLERLVEAGLCEERIAVRSDGCRVSRYRRTVEELRVEPADGEVRVETVARETPAGPAPAVDAGTATGTGPGAGTGATSD